MTLLLAARPYSVVGAPSRPLSDAVAADAIRATTGTPGKAFRSLYRVTKLLSFATCAMSTPLHDFRGRPVWGTWSPAQVILSVLPSDNGTLISITVPESSWMKLRHVVEQLRSADDEHFIPMVWELARSGYAAARYSRACPQRWRGVPGCDRCLSTALFVAVTCHH